ncbi:hypothetical protein B0H63DRAFT_493869 [Podospora didyma]|uniref:Transcription factor domain-containing protein n=1 Tax=Podospora didyma TaxID=330526 RepID=A0AAE0NUD4_9PEZI|nr:hypothetical protein B0H63DRAFT_493869 [Podospora didyma]
MSAASATQPRRRRPARNGPTPPGDPFIVVTQPNAKLDPASRKFIRSHVMLGKNRKRHAQPQNDRALTTTSWVSQNSDDQDDSSELGSTSTETSRGRISPALSTASSSSSTDSEPMSMYSKVPYKVGSEFGTFAFALDMKPKLRDLVQRWFVVIREAMYPEKLCPAPQMSPWIEYMAYDTAYLHTIFFSSQAFTDFSQKSCFGPGLITHCNNALTSLRENLVKSELATSDSTIAVVLSLTLMSEILADRETAKKHMHGLFQLVQLRGGLRGMSASRQLQAKICRADIGHAVASGDKPLFFAGSPFWDTSIDVDPQNRIDYQNRYPRFADSVITTAASNLVNRLDVTDARLVDMWLDLHEFAQVINLLVQLKKTTRPEMLHETVIMTQYRLVSLDHDMGEFHSVTEAIMRLGMLAFACTAIFQIRLFPMRYHHLAERVRHYIILSCTAEEEDKRLQKSPLLFSDSDVETTFLKLKLWFIFVAGCSVLNDPEDEYLIVTSLSQTLRRLNLMPESALEASTAWLKVQEILLEHMWIDYIHAKDGGALFLKTVLHVPEVCE